jgi:large subunit ribosomal protein L17
MKKLRKFSRLKDKRDQMMKSLSTSLIFYEKIETTLAKAKSLRPFVEKLISRSKNATLHDRRLLKSAIGNEIAVKKLVEIYGPKYQDRAGGYLRITKTGISAGDSAPTAIVEFV